MSRRVLWFLALLTLCASCRKVVEGQRLFRDMMVLRKQLATQFREARVQVNVIGSENETVVVTFVNSPLNRASSEEKQKRADEVAAFVMKQCKRPFREVRTFFVSQSGGTGGSVTGLDRYTGHPNS